MNKFLTRFRPKDYMSDWYSEDHPNFTGRVKYIKYTNFTEMRLEIKYTFRKWFEPPTLWEDLLWCIGFRKNTYGFREVTENTFLPDYYFISVEIPKISIVDCSND